MKRFLILILLLITAAYTVVAQTRLDSLIQKRQEALPDSLQVDLLIEIALEYYNTDLKKSLQHGQLALETAQSLGYDHGIQQALSVLSRIHRRLGSFSVAIDHNLRQISIAERLGDSTQLLDAYTTLGNIYSSLDKLEDSHRYLILAYRLGAKLNAPNLSSIMNFIGRNYGRMKSYDSALWWIHRALQQEEKFPQQGYTLSYIYNNLAEVYLLKEEYTEAIHSYLLAEQLPEEKTSPFGQTFTQNGLARSYMGMRRYADAIQAAKKSIAISMQYGYRDKTKESYGILYEIYEKLGDHEKALSNYKIFNLYQDSIFSEDRIQYIENLRINFETERMQHDNELLRKDAELKDARIAEQKSYTLIAIILTLSLTGAIIFLYYSYRQNKQRTRLLSDYNTNLEKQVERRTQELVKSNLELIRQNNQLEQFAFITAHNLRAPVARMLGLAGVVNLDTFDPKTDKALVESFRTTAEQLDGIIHDMNAILDVKKNTQANYEVVDFDERLRRIRNLLREPIESTHAKVESDFTLVKSCFAIPAYIESILYNLLSNALKYRSPDREPRVTIRTAIQENQLELTVQDNGIGMDLSRVKEKLFNLYQRFHLDIEGRGMGLFLVKTQVEAMNGSIQVTSAVNQGTTFRITFPLQMTSHVQG